MDPSNCDTQMIRDRTKLPLAVARQAEQNGKWSTMMFVPNFPVQIAGVKVVKKSPISLHADWKAHEKKYYDLLANCVEW